jgi:protocatechuate 3,4-dioxygenase alpha subunit
MDGVEKMNGWNFQELAETPSQTGGPYVHIGLLPKQANIEVFDNNFNNNLLQENTQGERIRLEGQVFDGLGLPLRDVLVEIWQADANGVYPSQADIQGKTADPHFQGWGRAGADFQTGVWTLTPLNQVQFQGVKVHSKHRILHWLFLHVVSTLVYTPVYFEDEAEANAKDPILTGIEWARRNTLLAKREERDGQVVYRFDIRIQGENETVFFDI